MASRFSRHLWWATFFREAFIKQLEVFRDSLQNRLLASFDDIEEEANKVTEEAWRRFGESASPDIDPGDLAESARDAGVQHYMNLSNLKQGLINAYASFCYHLFEQQLFYFHRKELLSQTEANDHRLFRLEEIQRRLMSRDVGLDGFAAWNKIQELRLVSNVVKHADGPSCEKLKARRPDMFSDPNTRDIDELLGESSVELKAVFQPMFGEDFYLTIQDLKEYVEAVIVFWNEMANLLQNQN